MRLVSITNPDGSFSEEPENLEITEGQNGLKKQSGMFEPPDDSKMTFKTFKRQQPDILLASKYLQEIQPQTDCSLWTKGLRRSFKVILFLMIQFLLVSASLMSEIKTSNSKINWVTIS